MVIDVSEAIDLHQPNRYLVRVKGHGLRHLGILDGDFLVTDTTKRPSIGRVVVAFTGGDVILATVEPRREGGWSLHFAEETVTPSEDLEVWAVATALVRARL